MLGRIGCPLQFLHDFFYLYQLYAVLLFFKKPSDKKLIDIVCLILQIMKFDTKPPQTSRILPEHIQFFHRLANTGCLLLYEMT